MLNDPRGTLGMATGFCEQCGRTRHSALRGAPDPFIGDKRLGENHIATRFGDGVLPDRRYWVELDGVQVEWAIEALAGRPGWVISVAHWRNGFVPFCPCGFPALRLDIGDVAIQGDIGHGSEDRRGE